MRVPGILTIAAIALALAVPCRADTEDFAALHADAKKSFGDDVTPFVKNYCSSCHGIKKQKGGINFEPALKDPGEPASGKRWKQALANVKAHDMPPEDADKQPTEEEIGRAHV